jgi:hypothetical protein
VPAQAITSAPAELGELQAAHADAARGAEDQHLLALATWPLVTIMRSAVP